MDTAKTYYVAGHRGMVGSAVVRALQRRGCDKILTATHRELDLTERRLIARA